MKSLTRSVFWGKVVSVSIMLMSVRVALASPPSTEARAGTSDAEVTQRSRELMREAASKFSKGDWQGAVLAYQKAWDLKKHPAIAANMAMAEMKLERFKEAAEHLRFALQNLSLDATEKREGVQVQLDMCLQHLLALRISVNLEGAEIFIDERRVGQSPLMDEILLEPGTHTVNVSRTGYLPQKHQVFGEAGQRVDKLFVLLSVTTEPRRPPGGVSFEYAPTETRGRWYGNARTWLIVSGGVASAISLGTGIIYRMKSNSDSDEHTRLKAEIDGVSSPSAVATNSACLGQSSPPICTSLHHNNLSYDRNRNVSTAALIGSGVLALGTVVTAILWPTEGMKAREAWQVAPSLAPGKCEVTTTVAF